jgi:hypothetical protein
MKFTNFKLLPKFILRGTLTIPTCTPWGSTFSIWRRNVYFLFIFEDEIICYPLFFCKNNLVLLPSWIFVHAILKARTQLFAQYLRTGLAKGPTCVGVPYLRMRPISDPGTLCSILEYHKIETSRKLIILSIIHDHQRHLKLLGNTLPTKWCKVYNLFYIYLNTINSLWSMQHWRTFFELYV